LVSSGSRRSVPLPAPDICPIEIDVMAQRYCTGALRQVVH
jgi:hypothetical protein